MHSIVSVLRHDTTTKEMGGFGIKSGKENEMKGFREAFMMSGGDGGGGG